MPRSQQSRAVVAPARRRRRRRTGFVLLLASLAFAPLGATLARGDEDGGSRGGRSVVAVSAADRQERFPPSLEVSGPDYPAAVGELGLPPVAGAARRGSAGTTDPAASAGQRALSKAGLRRDLRRNMRGIGGASGAWVYDLRRERRPVVFGDAARESRILASNTKLFTTASFLERFGAGGRLRTSVLARGQRSGVGDRVLRGDLVIVGDGDPAFGTKSFADDYGLPLTPIGDLARAVRRSGIERVRGDVLADDSIFDRRRKSGPYLTPLSGLSFNSGISSSGGYASQPELEAAKRLHSLLRKEGLRISGEPGRLGRKVKRRGEAVASVESPSAKTLVAATNKPSNNFFAEMLLKRVGAGGKRAGTTARGARRAERTARKYGDGASLHDGSGLSRRDKASPSEVGRLLVGVERRAKWSQSLYSSLPVAGRDGTLADRMQGTAAAGRCHAKTGSLSDVSALSGFCETKGRGLIAFSFLMNAVSVDSARNAQDRMTAAIARYGR